MFFFLSKIFDLAVAPVAWVLALIAYALLRTARHGRHRGAVEALALALVILYATSIGPVSNALMRHIEEDAPRTVRNDATYDAVIVLGGLVDEEATASSGSPAYNNNIERLLVAYDWLRSGRAKNAIVSSGPVTPVGPDVTESHVLAQQLASWGIPPNRIIVEDRSRNTRENAVECAKIAETRGYKSILMITSAFHMKRALGCFRAVGLPVDTLPVDYRSYAPDRFSGSLLPRAERLNDSTTALREMFGRFIYRARGYSK